MMMVVVVIIIIVIPVLLLLPRLPVCVLVHRKVDELIVENGLEVQCLLQVLIGLNKDILDLLEHLHVVH